MIDIQKAKEAFKHYVSNYKEENEKIKLKIIHTFGVMKVSEEIGKDLKLSNEDMELAQLIALLHDIGRFEQIAKENNFSDNNINHADYGVKLLFEDNIIRQFIQDNKYDDTIYNAISYHNKYKLPKEFQERTLLHAKLIRDADKTDILRVNIIEPLEVIFSLSTLELKQKEIQNQAISDKVYQDFMNRKCTLVSDWQNEIDSWIGNIAFLFDYNFTKGLSIVEEKGYIDKMVRRIHYQNPETKEKMAKIWQVAHQYIEQRCEENVIGE